MANLTIRNLPELVRARLRVRAAERGHSMEAEVRAILANAVGSFEREAPAASLDRLQDWIAANRRPVHGEKSAVGALLRDKRREAILEVIAGGLDPVQVFGDGYRQILAEANWSKAHVRQLGRRKA